jgi:hypothetical protein
MTRKPPVMLYVRRIAGQRTKTLISRMSSAWQKRKPAAMLYVRRSAGQRTNMLVSRMSSASQNGRSLLVKIRWKHDASRK